MSRFRNPRDFHDEILNFKKVRYITWLEQLEIARKKSKKKSPHEHFNKNWDKDLWD